MIMEPNSTLKNFRTPKVKAAAAEFLEGKRLYSYRVRENGLIKALIAGTIEDISSLGIFKRDNPTGKSGMIPLDIPDDAQWVLLQIEMKAGAAELQLTPDSVKTFKTVGETAAALVDSPLFNPHDIWYPWVLAEIDPSVIG